MPLSDITLLHRLTGTNRRYVMEWDNGEVAYFRANNKREAWKIAREFTARLTSDLTLCSVTHIGKDKDES
jgi:hypothetical protein